MSTLNRKGDILSSPITSPTPFHINHLVGCWLSPSKAAAYQTDSTTTTTTTTEDEKVM
jgi:hypothetical protein